MGHEHYIGAAQTFEIINQDDSRPDVVLLKVFYIDDTVNVNGWQTPWEGLKQDAKDIPGIPLVLQEDLQHPKFSTQQYFDRGTVYDYEIDEVNKKIIVYVRITDRSIVERIKSGELQYVSPAVVPRGSEYLKKKDGIDILERTIPIHLAIVGEPAYGKEKAQMSYLCSGDAKECDHRLRMMTAAKAIYESGEDCVSRKIGIIKRERPSISNEQAAAIAYSMCREGKTADSASDVVGPLTQIPLIKKMIAKTMRMASVLDKEIYGMKYHIHDGVEGHWINARDTDVFVARNQSIELAINSQCSCDMTAAKIQTTKEAANYRDTNSKTVNCVSCKYFNEKESSCSVVDREILGGHISDLYQEKNFQAADDPNIEKWITVKGNHIPIKKNQTKEEAVKEFLDKKDQTNNKKEKGKKPTSQERFKTTTNQIVNVTKKAQKEFPQEIKQLEKVWNNIPEKDRNLVDYVNFVPDFSEEGFGGFMKKVGNEYHVTVYLDTAEDVGQILSHEVGHVVSFNLKGEDSKTREEFSKLVDSLPVVNDGIDELSEYEHNTKEEETYAEVYAMKQWKEKHGNFDNYRWGKPNEKTYNELVKVLGKV